MQMTINPDASVIDTLNEFEAKKKRKFFIQAFAGSAILVGALVAVKLINDIETPEEQ